MRERVEILTVMEVATWLRIHPSTLYRMLNRQAIPAFKVGTDWRFRRCDVENWITAKADFLKG